ncbi:MAG TPA: tetratricopeptide repeat protein [Micromonosporaceae bacterium]|nr:tetratricopeptide repeat protein [Micromonosporaceae bacterium]
METLSDVLADAMRQAGIGSQTLSKLTGVPRTAIDNWREGTVRRPRHWRPLARIARVLSLSREEADALLAAAGYPGIAALAGDLASGHPDREHLDPWLARLEAPPRHQLRAPAADFVGRDDVLATLLAALRTTHTAAISGVRGMGGIGKTELAVLAANRLREEFPDAHLMLSLHGVSAAPLPAAHALRQVIHTFSPNTQLPDEVDALQRRYCAVLSGQRVLILADDASDASQVRPLLPPPGCALLVTSRQRFSLPGMTTVDLEQLTEAEAVELLKSICDRVTPTQARTLARACGYLPLALRVSGSVLLNDPALAVSDYVAALADRRQRLALLRDPDDAQLDVAASLALSYAGLDPPTRSVLRQLGVLSTDFDTDLAVAVVQTDGVDVTAALHSLLRRNLVGYDPARRRWRLHDLVADLAHGHLTEAGELPDTMWRYSEAAVQAAAATQEQFLSGGESAVLALARFDLDRPHLDTARRWAAAHAGTGRADQLLVAEAEASTHLGFLRYDHRAEITPQAHCAIAAARRLGDRRAEAIALNRLGRLHIDLGEVEQAIACHEQQLALVRSGGDQAGEVRALNGLAIAHTQFGQLGRAIQLHLEQLALCRRLQDRRGEAQALCNLGRTELSLGQVADGLAHLEPALEIAQDLGDPYGESIIRSNIGDACGATGDADAAMAHYEAAYAITRSLGDRHLEMEILAGLAPAAAAAGRAEQAVGHGTRALAVAREIGARQGEAKALRALGLGYAALGDVPRARAAFEEALAVLRTMGDRYGEAECGWDLGWLLVPVDRDLALSLLRASVAYQKDIGHARSDERASMLDQVAATTS